MDGTPPLGRLLRRHRSSASLTQEELADLARISVRTVSDVERGLRGSVHPSTAERLAAALGLPDADRLAFEVAARGRRGPRILDEVEVPRRPQGVPLSLTSLVGRDHELEVLRAALSAGGVRLMTVTGPGGVGKTRLALEVAESVTEDFPDGVAFVPLGALRDPGLVAAAIAGAVGVRLTPGSPTAGLMDQLGGRRLLLVLDTFEHLLAAAPLVGALVAGCPGLSVLVTSRSVLHLRGEHEFPLGPLEAPPGTVPFGELDRFPATALFLERARAVAPDLRLDRGTEEAIVAICRRLDGLPLALELAAARARHLSLPALRDHLEHRLTLLSGGPLDAPPRQRTLRDTMAWSYDLLPADNQRFLRESSVFAGGWTLEAAAAVCTTSDPLDAVSALVDHSLAYLADGTRYGLLDLIAEYAAERRDAEGETEALEHRHADHFLALAERAEPGLGQADQGSWYRLLDGDSANLRAALRSSIDSARAEVAVRLSGALWQFWRRRGDVAEGRAWLKAALDLPGPIPAAVRGKALWGAGWLAYHQGDLAEAEALGTALRSAAGEEGDPLGERNALTLLGKVSAARGRYERSAALLRSALAVCERLEPGWLLATSQFNLGVALVQIDDLAAGVALTEEAIRRYRDLGDAHFTAKAIGFRAYAALEEGDLPRARSLSITSLSMCVELGELAGIADALDCRAAVLAACGRAVPAARAAGAADRVRHRIGVQPTPDDRPMIDRYLARARAELGGSVWDREEEKGRVLPLDEALTQASVDE
ncbi:MAG: hypothetical protein QOC59_1713 [Microbacteriaceae bacterium]|nr:hypothetical protein [Microbacteriaceae bacterium]